MKSLKLTYLNSAILSSVMMLCSTASFAEVENSTVAKPFIKSINIQDFSQYENINTATDTINAIDVSQADAVNLNVENPADTIAAAKKSGVLAEVEEQKKAIINKINKPVVKKESIKKEDVKKEDVKVEQPKVESVKDTATKVDVSPVTESKNVKDKTIDSFDSKKVKASQVVNLSEYSKAVNDSTWSAEMKTNTAMTLKLQAMLDWNHASPGPLDGGWGGNSRKALKNFQAMRGLTTTGRMNKETWDALNKNVPSKRPVLINYTISKADVNYRFTSIPGGYHNKVKLPAMNYNNMEEMLAERYHMSVGYLKKLNPTKKFVAGEVIAIFNPSKNLKRKVTRVVADKKAETLYAYSGKNLVATYPTTVGSSSTPSPHGTFKIVNNVKKPHYRATVEKEGEAKKVYMLKPGPNSPVGIVWMGLSKPSYGIHGSPVPEGISRQASHGCIRLTNWDALEVHKNIRMGATVELK